MSDKIEVEIRINQTVYANTTIGDVVYQINELPMPKRWNYVGILLRELVVIKDDLTVDQKKVIIDFLKQKLSELESNALNDKRRP